MNLSMFQHHIRTLAASHATEILTAASVIGTVTTAYLTGKATFKAAEIIREAELAHVVDADEHTMGMSTWAKTKKVWPNYAPAAAAGLGTISATILANRLSAQRAAALLAVASLSERQFKEYRDKVSEKLTGPKQQAVMAEIANDNLHKHPYKETVVLLGGEVLCFDVHSGRYFKSSMEKIRKAENEINHQIYLRGAASLSDFYDAIDIPQTGYSDEVGWSTNQPLEIFYDTQLDQNDKPCITIAFTNPPGVEWTKPY